MPEILGKNSLYDGAKVQLSPKENRDLGIIIKFTYDFDNYFGSLSNHFVMRHHHFL